MNNKKIKEQFSGARMERLQRSGVRDSSVLIPLVERQGEANILFEVRSKNIAQGGEICFPGGRVEAGEAPQQTAVRETAEELAIAETQITVIAPLFELIGPGGGSVYAYLGELTDYQDTFSTSEVGRIFLMPIQDLLSMQPRTHDDHMAVSLAEDFPYELIPHGRNYPFHQIPRRFYFYETKYGVIWGLTGELLYRFLGRMGEDGVGR